MEVELGNELMVTGEEGTLQRSQPRGQVAVAGQLAYDPVAHASPERYPGVAREREHERRVDRAAHDRLAKPRRAEGGEQRRRADDVDRRPVRLHGRLETHQPEERD